MTTTSNPHTATDATLAPEPTIHQLRDAFATGRTRSLQWRQAQLDAIIALLTTEEAAIVDALAQDLGRNAFEAWLGDIASTKAEAEYSRKHLRGWMRPRRAGLPLSHRPGRAWVQCDPLGVVLVIGPWNYPVYLTLGPLIAAVAAGNTAVLKPSELAPATSRLLATVVPKYLDPEAVRVVEGDGATTQALIAAGVDHILFTGGTTVGKKIMAAAAPSLTPVTLELGGKSPVIVAADADLDVAARRISWLKLMNSGQTCIAPDYILADATIKEELTRRIIGTIRQFRGQDAGVGQQIVNERQFDRLASLIATTRGQVVCGGHADRQGLRIQPTVIVDPGLDDAVMAEEIFGPILPVLPFSDTQNAVALANLNPNPLALYVFSSSRRWARDVVDRVPSGGAVINHVGMHCLAPQLPFGGVGPSGMGAYHGKWGFETLSHRRAVLAKPARPDPRLIYPPYTDRAMALMRKLM